MQNFNPYIALLQVVDDYERTETLARTLKAIEKYLQEPSLLPLFITLRCAKDEYLLLSSLMYSQAVAVGYDDIAKSATFHIGYSDEIHNKRTALQVSTLLYYLGNVYYKMAGQYLNV
jgi:hypothetical protein